MSSVAEKPVNQIEALSEAITIFHRANGGNNCAWAEAKINRAIAHIRKQQTALCEFHFMDRRPTYGDLRKLEDVGINEVPCGY